MFSFFYFYVPTAKVRKKSINPQTNCDFHGSLLKSHNFFIMLQNCQMTPNTTQWNWKKRRRRSYKKLISISYVVVMNTQWSKCTVPEKK